MRCVFLFLCFLSLNSCNKPNSILQFCDCETWENWQNHKEIRCGFITVPENHDMPNAKSIKIAFAIFEGKNTSKDNTPTIILSGGPGGVSLGNPETGLTHEARNVGDVILVDQRGMGFSGALPEFDLIEVMGMDVEITEEYKIVEELMRKEMLEIKSKGIDPSKYNSTQNAKDFGVLMEELDYEQYNLFGTSYGTRLGILIMKYFSPKIHAAILDGPTFIDSKALESRFPNLQRSLTLLFAKCNGDSTCSSKYPNLRPEMIKGIESLKEMPITIKMLGKDFVINPQDALFILRYLLYSESAYDIVPQFIQAINDRDVSLITKLSDWPVAGLRGFNTSAYYSFALYEEYDDSTPENVESFIKSNEELSGGLAWFQTLTPALHIWHGDRMSEAESKVEEIKIPTLLITNLYDPVTPPHNAIPFEKALLNEKVLILNRFGHGARGACISQVRNSFLRDPQKADLKCLEDELILQEE